MEQQFSLADGRGVLKLHEEGPRVVFDVECKDDGKGLYKAYLCGAGGRLLLGTLMPEHGVLRLKRTLTSDELRRKKLWPVTGATAELAFSFQQSKNKTVQTPASGTQIPAGWVWEPNPGRRMGDRVLVQACQHLDKAFLFKKGEGFLLAVPYLPGHEFPLTPLFCFAQVKLMEEKYYLIFTFNQQGCPVFPNRGPGAGKH